MKNPFRAAAVAIGLIALGALPKPVEAQDDGRVAQAALSVPGAQDAAAATKTQSATKPKQATRKPGKPRSRTEANAKVPRATFEDRTSHYFDPLSLTLAPEHRPDPVKSQYDEVTDSVAPPDKPLVSKTPDDSESTQISSASIEQLGKGRNNTVVVPLFQILNNLSPGPASQ